jgi:ligand-binding sensor domain-containing protein
MELIDSTVLFGTNKGIFKLEGTKLVQFSNINTNNIDIKSINSDGEKIWFLGKELVAGTLETYLYSIDLSNRKNIRKIGKNNGLADEPTQMFIDHEGNVWTTSNNGVSLLKGNAFVAFNSANGMAGNKTWGITKLSDGSLWVGTIGEGLTIINDNKFTTYSTKNGLPDNYIAKIFQAKNGEIYLGTGNAGICRATYNNNSKSYKFVRLPLLMDSKLRVDDILEDRNGTLWVASNKGLFYSKNYTNFIQAPLFPNDTGQVFVQKLLVDTLRNFIWIGTRYNGVFTMQNGKVLQFDLLDSKLEVTSLEMDNSV